MWEVYYVAQDPIIKIQFVKTRAERKLVYACLSPLGETTNALQPTLEVQTNSI
jgi:hypothetical protein